MYCGKCGSFNQDGATFCQNCGSPLTAQTPPQQNPYPYPPQQQPQKKKTGLVIGLCVAIAAVITGLVFLGIWLFGDDGPLGGGKSSDRDRGEESDVKGGVQSVKDVPKAYITAMASGDVDAYIDLLPQKMLDAYLEATDTTEKDFRKDCKNDIRETLDELNDEYGDDWSMSAEDIETDSLKKSALKDVQKQYDALDLDVTDAAIVSFEAVVTVRDEDGDTDTVDSASIQIGAVEIGGRWYLHNDDLWMQLDLPYDEDDDNPSQSSNNGFKNEGDAVAAAVRAMFADADAEAYLALIPDEVLDTFLEYFDINEKELKKEFQNWLDAMREEVEDAFGRNCQVAVMIQSTSDWEPSKSEIQEYQEFYDSLGKITDMASVNFLAFVNAHDQQVSEDNFFAVKIDGRWYPECLELLSEFAWALTDE